MTATISTHNGSRFSQKHNRRDPAVVSKEKHINPNGKYEIWLDIDIKTAYKQVFEEARLEYNQKQKRKDRQIEDYYEHIKNDKKKNVGYELIVGVYDSNVSTEEKRAILYEYAKGFKNRNKSLFVTGIYYHNDEMGKDPHLHITYFGVAKDCNRGMKIQNSLDKALEQQGIVSGTSIHETRQINWQRSENAYLEKLCIDKGIHVEHPKERKNHLETDIYKLQMAKQEIQKQINDLEQRKVDIETLKKEALEDSETGILGKKKFIKISREVYSELVKSASLVQNLMLEKHLLEEEKKEFERAKREFQERFKRLSPCLIQIEKLRQNLQKKVKEIEEFEKSKQEKDVIYSNQKKNTREKKKEKEREL